MRQKKAKAIKFSIYGGSLAPKHRQYFRTARGPIVADMLRRKYKQAKKLATTNKEN